MTLYEYFKHECGSEGLAWFTQLEAKMDLVAKAIEKSQDDGSRNPVTRLVVSPLNHDTPTDEEIGRRYPWPISWP